MKFFFNLNSFSWNDKLDKLQIILLEEGEFTDQNYELMQSAWEYWNTYLFDKNGKLFLTADPLITLSNIITDSQNLFLIDVNPKPAGFDKMYFIKLDKISYWTGSLPTSWWVQRKKSYTQSTL